MGPRCPGSRQFRVAAASISICVSQAVEKQHAADVWPHTGCASSLYAQSSSLSGIQILQRSEFHVSKLLCSSLSGIQTLQQYFRYPNLAAVFQVSKPCNSLSGIQIKPCSSLTLRNQTLQQPNSFTYPNLAVVFQVSKPYRQQPAKRRSSSSPNHRLQAVLHKKHSL